MEETVLPGSEMFSQEEDGIMNPITIDEIERVVKSLKKNKACAEDGITNEHMKYCSSDMLVCILKLFNGCIRLRSFPSEWAKSLISMLFKKGSRLDPNNYRPVSVSSCLGKLF